MIPKIFFSGVNISILHITSYAIEAGDTVWIELSNGVVRKEAYKTTTEAIEKIKEIDNLLKNIHI